MAHPHGEPDGYRAVLRRRLAVAVALCHLLLASITPPALAQSADAVATDGIDREPPVIEFEPLVEGRRGDAQVFSARVGDDVDVVSVTLRYRFAADEAYRTATMERLGETDVYTVSIPGAETDVAAIQYYIVARDGAGNRSIEGFAFDPLERRLSERATNAAADPADTGTGRAAPGTTSPTVTADGMSTGRKVLYGVLGVIAVGALAAAVGGDDGGGGEGPQGDDPGGSDVPVTFVIDPP